MVDMYKLIMCCHWQIDCLICLVPCCGTQGYQSSMKMLEFLFNRTKFCLVDEVIKLGFVKMSVDYRLQHILVQSFWPYLHYLCTVFVLCVYLNCVVSFISSELCLWLGVSLAVLQAQKRLHRSLNTSKRVLEKGLELFIIYLWKVWIQLLSK